MSEIHFAINIHTKKPNENGKTPRKKKDNVEYRENEALKRIKFLIALMKTVNRIHTA